MRTVHKISACAVVCLLLFVAHCQNTGSDTDPIVAGENIAIANTEYGKVRGYIHNGTYVYKGIPYAKAERFMAPEKPDPWEGVRSSMAWGPTCPMMTPPNVTNDEVEFLFQHDYGYFGEDCMRLNIWTPEINGEKRRPVMVWIHGGGYTYGSSQELPCYDGENLSKKGDIVYVSLNHRLNVLGFLDLSAYGEKYSASANASMRDLVAALEWIRGNIANFGGDPGNVTIFGQSGGGGKVSTLMNAPSAKGLFHRAVVQSGANPRFQKQELTRRLGRAVAQELKIRPSQIDEIQTVPYNELAAAAQRAMNKLREQLIAEGITDTKDAPGFAPTLDGDFLPYEQTDPRALALSNEVPLMIGSTKNEFAKFVTAGMKDTSLDTVMQYIKKTYGDKAENYVEAVKKAYPEDTDPSDLIEVDIMFRRGTVIHANLKSANSDAPVYMYLFSWQSPIFDGKYKAIHCMELPFVFNNVILWKEMTGAGKETHVLADKVSQAWINFARYGDPHHKGLPEWEPYTEKYASFNIAY